MLFGFSTRQDGADLILSSVLGPLVRKGRRTWSWWLLLSACVLMLPLADLVVNLFAGGGEVWMHLVRTVLPRYIFNTIVLGLGTLLLSGIIGTWLAWLMARYRFPGKTIFEVLLILPLALPPYISAYAWSGMFDYGGPIRSFLTLFLEESQAARVGVANMGGAVFILSMALYPYVYLSLRSTIARSVAPQLEAARSLGTGRSTLFFRMALPLARPALVAGLGLVLMEVLNEYGAVSYLGVDTLTAGVFRAWFHFYDIQSARRIGGILLLFVFLLIGVESRQRSRKRFHTTNNRRQVSLEPLSGWRLWRAYLGLALLLFLAIGAPVLKLSSWASRTWPYVLRREFLVISANSLLLVVIAGTLCLILATTMVYARKLVNSRLYDRISQAAFLGYAIPGAVIALGVMQLGGRVDQWITGGQRLLFSGSIAALVFAYAIRYLAIAQRPVSAVLEERFAAVDEASLSLGKSPLPTLLRIHLPNMRGTLAAAGILIFLDIIKELPLTMILRPFNFNTLAVRTFELAANEQVAESAVPALALILISALGVLSMTIITRRSKKDVQ